VSAAPTTATSDTTATSVDHGGMRLVVTAGGTPTDEELAALTVVLTAGFGAAPAAAVQPPAWARAALLEGVGGPLVDEPAKLRSLSALG
jgi:hypothetical protein